MNGFPVWISSFEEMGTKDTSAAIDYILNLTFEEKLFYIGHSQGTTQFFTMLALRPEYNSKIRLMSAFAPAAFLDHLGGALLTVFSILFPIIRFIVSYPRTRPFPEADPNVYWCHLGL
jgi:pimeloyl-ACP methyl ester carboxylesterase